MSRLTDVILKDVIANLPAAGNPGRLFFATDTHVIKRDNGTTWDDVTPSGGGTGGGTYAEEVVSFSGTSATLSHTPATFVGLYESGKKLRKVGSSPEFSLSTATITLSYTPLSGVTYVASYWY